MPRSTINFDTVRNIGLALPGVEESTAYGQRRSRCVENSWRASPLIPRLNLARLLFAWISMTAPSCSLRTLMFTT